MAPINTIEPGANLFGFETSIRFRDDALAFGLGWNIPLGNRTSEIEYFGGLIFTGNVIFGNMTTRGNTDTVLSLGGSAYKAFGGGVIITFNGSEFLRRWEEAGKLR